MLVCTCSNYEVFEFIPIAFLIDSATDAGRSNRIFGGKKLYV